MNEIQLLLWPVVISALKKKKGTKKPNQTKPNKQTNKKRSLKKSQNIIMGKFGKSSSERQQKLRRLSQNQR